MRFKALIVATAAAGALVFSAAPASAAANWQAVDTNSTWSCSSYKTHQVSDYVKYKVCGVYNANGDAQAVLVVQNSASVAVSIGGEVWSSFGSNVQCASSTLNPGFTRGCFAPTVHVGGSPGTLSVNGRLVLNGVSEWYA